MEWAEKGADNSNSKMADSHGQNRSFVSRHIHEEEGVDGVVANEVRRRGYLGLIGIQRERVATYREEDGRLVDNGISYLVRGTLVGRIE